MSLLFCPLFKGISPNEIDVIMQSVESLTHRYSAGEIIAYRGDPYNSLMIIINGTAKGEMIDISGKVVKIEEMKTGMPLAIAFLFSNDNRLPVNISAVEETKILFLPKQSVIEIMQKNSLFLSNFLQLISNRAKFLSDRIWFLSFKTIREKLANYILEKAENDKTNIKFELTQQEIADYFGVTRPAFARSVAKLQEDNIIKIDKKTITIIDKEKLKQIAQ